MRHALALFALTFMALLGWSAAAHASPPANDSFAGAEALSPFPPTGKMGTNVEATKEAGEPAHAGDPGGHSVWFSWTPASSGPVAIRTPIACFGGLDSLVAVYTGASVDALTQVASNESLFASNCFFSEPPQAEFEAVAGTTYWIAVDGKDGDEAPFELLIDPPPANDDFADAETIAAEPPQSVFGTTRLTSKEEGESNHAGDAGGHSVWYEWTPTSSGPVEISTCSSFSSLDAVLAVYTGSAVNALTPVASNDDGSENESFPGCTMTDSQVSVDAVAGTTYRIAIDGASGSVGRFGLRIRGRPQNDAFSSPQVLGSELPVYVSETTNKLATKEGSEPNHAGDPGGHSVWYEWTPSSGGRVTISTCSSAGKVDTLLAVYTGSAVNTLTPVVSNDDIGDTGNCLESNSEVRFTAEAGTTYRVAVDAKGGDQGKFSLFLEAPPANDAFAKAQALPASIPAFSIGSTRSASEEAGEPDHGSDQGGRSVWYSWTPSSSGSVEISICPYKETSPDTLLAVYTGSAVNTLTPVASNDDSPAACKSFGSQVQLAVTAGTTYWVAVDSKGGEGNFSVEIEGPAVNDDLADATVLPDNPMTAGGSTAFATKEAGEPNHAGDPGGQSVWFSWTPSSSGPVEITACGRNGTDTLLAVYTGSAVNALTAVASNDDATADPANGMCQSPDDSEVVLNAVAGTTYLIAVDTKGGKGRFGMGFIFRPQNDAFAAAQELTGPLPLFAAPDLKLASKETGEPNHAGDGGGHSVWFEWTPTSTGPVSARTCTWTGSVDALLAVYTGSTLAGLTPVASADDGSTEKGCRATDGEAVFTAVAGTTYVFALDGKGGSVGPVQLIVEGVAANDDFGKPQPLGGALPAQWGFTSNRFASKQAGEPNHAGEPGGASIWFKWTAPISGPVSVDTCGSGFDTLLAVYTGSAVNALTPVGANDDGSGKCGPQSKLTFNALENAVYRIAIDGKGGDQGALELSIRGRPGNDDFEAAQAIPGLLGWYWPGSTLLATKEAGEPDHAGDAGGHSVWFRWTPTKSEAVELDACSDSFDPLLAVYTGSALGSLTPMAIGDAGRGECDEGRSVRFDVVAGTAYLLAVDGAGGDDGRFELHLREATDPVVPPPPTPGGSGTGTGGAVPPIAGPIPGAPPRPKPLKCKRGFKKKLVKGKARCVKKKKGKAKKRRHP